MFTADGRLRDEFAADDLSPEADAAADAPLAVEPASPPPGSRAEPASDPFESPAQAGARLEIPGTPPGLGPTFLDLVAVLAEPVSIYLGDLTLPDGETAENLEAARFHIDLLDVLRQRTAGSLSVQERTTLDDLLYRLRMRYVQKRG